jgi:PAS domain S-box-containing protein
MKLTYRNKLLLWVIPTLAAGLLALSLSSYLFIHHVIEQELTKQMLVSTGKSAETIEHWLNTLLLEPETIAATPAAMAINRDFTQIDHQNVFRYRILHRKYPDIFKDIYAANRTGEYHTVLYDEKKGYSFFKGSVSDRDYFKTIMAGGPSQITQPLVSRTTGLPTIFVVAPIKDEQDQPQGLIGAGISLSYVKKVAESLTAGKTGYGFIIARDGTFISHPNSAFVMKKKISEFEEDSILALGKAMLSGGSGSFRYTYEGVDKMAFYQPIPRAGWAVATTLPIQELFEPATLLLKYFTLVTLAITLVIAAMIVVATRRLTDPLHRLASHAELIGGGNLQLPELDIGSGDEIGTLAAAFNSMTARLRETLGTLSRSEHQYRTLVDNLSVGIYRSRPGPRGEMVQVNPAMLSIFRYEDSAAFLGLCLSSLFEQADPYRDFLEQLRTTGSVHGLEVALRRQDGSSIWCQMNAKAHRDEAGQIEWIDGAIEDISERKRLEEQLRQSQKMEAIGTLAGGIAHDFNNLLTAIIGYANLALEHVETDPEATAFLDQILSASQRASKLTRSLLAFSRKQSMTLTPIDVNETVRRIELLLARLIGEDIEFSTELEPAPLTVLADATQLEQVLMNLATNARDALPVGGKLTISTRRFEVAEAGSSRSLEPGLYAEIAVSDTGLGMDDSITQRMFEPFFTTKGVGKGTGLGLSIVYGIVKQLGGEIMVQSEPSRGTTFRIYLKAIELCAEPPDAPGTAVPAGGEETILLAEDDASVRDLYRTVLERAGYRVIEALDGVDAVEKFIQSRTTIDLLLFDVVMPKMNGKEAFEAIRKLAPATKILYSSGYAREIKRGLPLIDGQDNHVPKPASPMELLGVVRNTLDRD